MSEPLPVRVPDRALPTMRGLAALNDVERGRVVEALRSVTAEDSISLSTLRHTLAESLTVEDAVVESRKILSQLFALQGVSASHDWPVSDVASAAASTPSLDLSTDAQHEFAEFLTQLLQVPAIRIFGKADDLANEHERVLHTVRIVTDLTPVFDDPSEEPIGAVVSHRLRFTYWKNGEVDESEIALSSNDLDKLARVVDRARAKADSLDGLLARISLPSVSAEDPDDAVTDQ